MGCGLSSSFTAAREAASRAVAKPQQINKDGVAKPVEGLGNKTLLVNNAGASQSKSQRFEVDMRKLPQCTDEKSQGLTTPRGSRNPTMKSQWWTTSFSNPTAVICEPGNCVIEDRWVPLILRERIQETHDTALLTFELEDKTKPLGLPTVSFILARFQPGSGKKAVVRPYTPVSTNALLGKFQILIKAYESGQMSQHLLRMPLGNTLEFKHTKECIPAQYPFGHRRITMLVGGTGITPMLQALHAILGTPGDETQVTMIYSNKRAEDVLCKELLDRWSVVYRERFRLIYVFSRDENIHIEKKMIKKHAGPPADDAMIMVCGPPKMYDSLCGDRDSPALTGALRDLGYKAAHVAKL